MIVQIRHLTMFSPYGGKLKFNFLKSILYLHIKFLVSCVHKLKLNGYLVLLDCKTSLCPCRLGVENLDKLVMILNNWLKDARVDCD